MAIARVGSPAVTQSPTTTTLSVNIPPSPAPGDFIAVWVVGKGMGSTSPNLAGYLLHSKFHTATVDIAFFYKFADGSESTLAGLTSTNSSAWGCHAQRYTGVHPSLPFALGGPPATQNGNQNDTSLDDTNLIVTTIDDNAMILTCIGVDAASWDEASGKLPAIQTAGFTPISQTITYMVSHFSESLQAVAGPSPEIYWTWGTADAFSAMATALNPSLATGGSTRQKKRMLRQGTRLGLRSGT
jgi:hypothetical protein